MWMIKYVLTAKINISCTFFCRFFFSQILLSVHVEEIRIFVFKVKFHLHFLQLWKLYLNFLVENFEISSNSIQYLGCWRCLAGVENWDKKINEKKNSNKKINMLNTLLAYHRLPFQQDSVVSCNSNY